MPEERQRDVKVASLDDPGGAAEGVALPVGESVAYVGRERDAAEETQAVMACHGSGRCHT
jgi:hypothetical protein